MSNTIIPSLDYIAGIVETSGSFYWSNTTRKAYPVFQVKLVGRETDLLKAIKSKLGLNEVVHEYLHDGRHYAVLTVRRRSSIERIILPFLDQRLIGSKQAVFDAWRDRFYQQILAKS